MRTRLVVRIIFELPTENEATFGVNTKLWSDYLFGLVWGKLDCTKNRTIQLMKWCETLAMHEISYKIPRMPS